MVQGVATADCRSPGLSRVWLNLMPGAGKARWAPARGWCSGGQLRDLSGEAMDGAGRGKSPLKRAEVAHRCGAFLLPASAGAECGSLKVDAAPRTANLAAMTCTPSACETMRSFPGVSSQSLLHAPAIPLRGLWPEYGDAERHYVHTFGVRGNADNAGLSGGVVAEPPPRPGYARSRPSA